MVVGRGRFTITFARRPRGLRCFEQLVDAGNSLHRPEPCNRPVAAHARQHERGWRTGLRAELHIDGARDRAIQATARNQFFLREGAQFIRQPAHDQKKKDLPRAWASSPASGVRGRVRRRGALVEARVFRALVAVESGAKPAPEQQGRSRAGLTSRGRRRGALPRGIGMR